VTAIHQDPEPFNSLRHNLLTLGITLGDCCSAEAGGVAVTLDQLRA
jgi:hypothetical protein